MTPIKTSILFLTTYFALRFGLDAYWREVSHYYSYLFEFLFVGAAFYFYKTQFKWGFHFKQELQKTLGPSLVIGALLCSALTKMNLGVPIAFDHLETIFLLIALAPVLEELIFRFALWEPLSQLIKNQNHVNIITAILFSLSHAFAYFYVPEDYKVFVQLQVGYTLILGLYAGHMKIKHDSLASPLFVHFGWNFGFYLASLI